MYFYVGTPGLYFSRTHTYAPRLHKTPWKDLEPYNVGLGHGGGAAPANPGELAALRAGEVVGLDHKLTQDPGVAEVGAGNLSAWAHGEGRRRRPRRLGSGDGKSLAWTTSGTWRSYGV
jgi:hypothetical protein